MCGAEFVLVFGERKIELVLVLAVVNVEVVQSDWRKKMKMPSTFIRRRERGVDCLLSIHIRPDQTTLHVNMDVGLRTKPGESLAWATK